MTTRFPTLSESRSVSSSWIGSTSLHVYSFFQDKNLAILYKNRAAVHIKQDEFEDAAKDCSRSLELVPNDPKALYRRCQAQDSLGNFEAAYKDAREVLKLDPGNKAIQPFLVKLHKAVSEKVQEMSQVGNKAKSMIDIVFDASQVRTN